MRRRNLVLALLLAVALGFVAGWLVGRRRGGSFEERLEDARERIRHRADELTH